MENGRDERDWLAGWRNAMTHEARIIWVLLAWCVCAFGYFGFIGWAPIAAMMGCSLLTKEDDA